MLLGEVELSQEGEAAQGEEELWLGAPVVDIQELHLGYKAMVIKMDQCKQNLKRTIALFT